MFCPPLSRVFTSCIKWSYFNERLHLIEACGHFVHLAAYKIPMLNRKILSWVFVYLFYTFSQWLIQSEGILTCSLFSQYFKSPSYEGTKSVLAEWIQDDQGNFIKRKCVMWDLTPSDHLPNWAVNSGGPASNALSSLCNKTDATTEPLFRFHGQNIYVGWARC